MDLLPLEKPALTHSPNPQRFWVWPRTSLLVLAAAFFLSRSLTIPLTSGGLFDLRVHYASTRAFWAGENPYDEKTIIRFWTASGTADQAPDQQGAPSLYPPTSFILMAPLVFLSWRAAVISWIIVHILALGALFYAWSRHLPSSASPRARFWLAGCILLLAPLPYGIVRGQPTITVFVLVGFTILAAIRRKDTAAGLLLAASTCFKPHLALCLLLYYVLVGRGKIAFIALVAVAVIGNIAIAQLALHHIPWMHDALANLGSATAPGGVNDPSTQNRLSEHILSLAVILYRFTDHPVAVSAIAWTITIALAAFAIGPILRAPKTAANQLLACAAILAISTLPVYHRFYDGAFFIVALAWAIGWADHRTNPWTRASVIVCSLIFVLPPGTIPMVVRHIHIGPSITQTQAWRLLVIYPAWATLGLAIALVAAIRCSIARELE